MKKRRRFTTDFKAKVALEAIKGQQPEVDPKTERAVITVVF